VYASWKEEDCYCRMLSCKVHRILDIFNCLLTLCSISHGLFASRISLAKEQLSFGIESSTIDCLSTDLLVQFPISLVPTGSTVAPTTIRSVHSPQLRRAASTPAPHVTDMEPKPFGAEMLARNLIIRQDADRTIALLL
jgi:hypothetical protein